MKLRCAAAIASLLVVAVRAETPELLLAPVVSTHSSGREPILVDENPRLQFRVLGANDRQGSWSRLQSSYELGEHGIVRLRYDRTISASRVAALHEATLGWTMPLADGWRTTLRVGASREADSRDRFLEIFIALSF